MIITVGANCGSPDSCFEKCGSANLNPNSSCSESSNSIPNRKASRLKGYDYSYQGAYFVTICCHEKRHLFGVIADGEMLLNAYGRIVQEEWEKTALLRENIILDAFVVMPNHFHAVMIINATPECKKGEPQFVKQEGEPQFAPTVGDVMKGFKQAVTLQIRAKGYLGKVWQRGYYDHIIRNTHDYDATVEYIHNNPKNWHRDKNNQVGG